MRTVTFGDIRCPKDRTITGRLTVQEGTVDDGLVFDVPGGPQVVIEFVEGQLRVCAWSREDRGNDPSVDVRLAR